MHGKTTKKNTNNFNVNFNINFNIFLHSVKMHGVTEKKIALY
jgi:hypothetical protein